MASGAGLCALLLPVAAQSTRRLPWDSMACFPVAHSRPLRNRQGREGCLPRSAFRVPLRVRGGAGELVRRRVLGLVSAVCQRTEPCAASLDGEARRLEPPSL